MNLRPTFSTYVHESSTDKQKSYNFITKKSLKIEREREIDVIHVRIWTKEGGGGEISKQKFSTLSALMKHNFLLSSVK